MTLCIRCPECEHEFVVASAPPGSAAVCPRCFHSFPIAVTCDSAAGSETLEALEQIWSDAETEPETDQGDTATAQAPAKTYGQPSHSRPALLSEPGQPAAASLPTADSYQDESWKATLLGCLLPIAILVGIIAFFAWYIISRTGTSVP